jgi:hypothetical protein
MPMVTLMLGRAPVARMTSTRLRANAVATARWPEGYRNTPDPGDRRATSSLSSLAATSARVGAASNKMTACQRRKATQANTAPATVPPTAKGRKLVEIAVASWNSWWLWAPSAPNAHASTKPRRSECQTSPPSMPVTTTATAVAMGAQGGARGTKPCGARTARHPSGGSCRLMGPGGPTQPARAERLWPAISPPSTRTPQDVGAYPNWACGCRDLPPAHVPACLGRFITSSASFTPVLAGDG